jgi:hypothetical protein
MEASGLEDMSFPNSFYMKWLQDEPIEFLKYAHFTSVFFNPSLFTKLIAPIFQYSITLK